MTRRIVLTGAAVGVALAGLTSCDAFNTVSRPVAPVVLTGADLPALVGTDPGVIVAFRLDRAGSDATWTQIPVQVDQRKVVAFGTQPADNTTPGTTGTVYGNGSGGPTALQYADPNTFVGADTDPTFDADDELVFMASDGGAKPATDQHTEPAGVVAGSGVQVQFDDPRGADERGWVYLFRSAGGLDPSAGKDYVDYDFNLTSGDYKTTYKRADGFNPETSTVVTPTYQIDFTDRWKETAWRITAGGATGVDILDAPKNVFAPGNCGRSNNTFADGEGAFVANIDGPVRAIRSYVGANSGPKTQRTHLLYRDHEETVTDLRVHAIPGITDFVDYSSAAVGMTYRSSGSPGGFPIDGTPDSPSATTPTWEAVSGPQGLVVNTIRFTTSASGLTGTAFYRDQTTPLEAQCWGDASYYGASGAAITSAIPNTDPGSTPFDTLVGRRTTWFAGPVADGSVATAAADLAADVDTPLQVTVSGYAS